MISVYCVCYASQFVHYTTCLFMRWRTRFCYACSECLFCWSYTWFPSCIDRSVQNSMSIPSCVPSACRAVYITEYQDGDEAASSSEKTAEVSSDFKISIKAACRRMRLVIATFLKRRCLQGREPGWYTRYPDRQPRNSPPGKPNRTEK